LIDQIDRPIKKVNFISHGAQKARLPEEEIELRLKEI